ncbi:ribonuclease HI family protein [Candidatus Microgenomates bacterium]|nr:ribonuclease HI family protein [Candidatus Microgenomates bacterium]
MVLNVFCDGGARGNPGPAAIGVVIKNGEGSLLHKFGKKIGATTNNVAEYTAVTEALSWIAQNNKPVKIHFYLDSQLVVSQLNGLFKVKDGKLKMLVMKVRQKEAQVGGNVSYEHIPREKNIEADSLVNVALG